MATKAVTWTLPSTGDVSSRVGTESFLLEATRESVMSPDLRSRVDPRDFADGGKYRSIVKLIIRYEGQTEKGHAMGTGWLIRPDLMVTAGHNVFDWSGGDKGFGKAIEIKCYIGYHGTESVASSSVQFRLAKTIVTTAEWTESRDNRHRDVAFIQVDRAFEDDLRLFNFKGTPKEGHFMLGVVGYPGDKSLETDAGEERGAEMYEMFHGQEYSLDAPGNPLHLLEYDISTYGGQSGAPVIRKDSKNMVAIGTHVYGGGTKNSASAIGKFGNDYDALLKAFTPQNLQLVSETTDRAGINVKVVKIESTPSTSKVGFAGIQGGAAFNSSGFTPQPSTAFANTGFNSTNTGFNPTNTGLSTTNSTAPNHEEGFFDVFSDVAKFVSGALPTVAPFLGPIGGPIAAIAGTALGTLARAESAFDGEDPQSISRAAANRAVLAEAALQTVLKMEQGPALQKVVSAMEESYRVNAPNIKALAPRLAPAILDAAKRINPNGEYNDINSRPRQTRSPRRLRTDGSESAFGTSDFAAALLQAEVKPLVGEEGFFDGLGSAISSGFRIAKPWLAKGAKIGLELLSNRLSAESAFDTPGVNAETIAAAELVSKRAILGEAALQALDKLDKADLARVSVTGSSPGAHEESFFGGFLSIVQKVGSVVTKVAPTVINTVLPIAQNLLGGGSESFTEVAPPKLRKTMSCAEMLEAGSLQALTVSGGGVNGAGSGNQVSNADFIAVYTLVSSSEGQCLTPPGEQFEPTLRVPSLEEVQARYLVDGPDLNEDKPVFQVYDWE